MHQLNVFSVSFCKRLVSKLQCIFLKIFKSSTKRRRSLCFIKSQIINILRNGPIKLLKLENVRHLNAAVVDYLTDECGDKSPFRTTNY